MACTLFFGLGCAWYFSLPAQPAPEIVGAILILSLLILWFSRRHILLFFGAALLLAVCCGMAISAFHLWADGGPTLKRTLYSATLSGRVIAIEPQAGRTRIILAPIMIEGMEPENQPRKVRISMPGTPDFGAGDVITVSGRLFPLRPPAVPGDPDFARRLYLDGIGATGFVFGRNYQVTQIATSGFLHGWSDRISDVRHAIMAEVNRAMAPDHASVANALIVGERGDISPKIAEDLRKSGLAHLLAISGLHMGLLCGTVFFFVRLVLAAIPPLALRYPVKKWAACAAMIAGAFYLVLSGGTVPTQRAYVMTGIVLFAVLVDRRAISLRLVALAALVVLIVRPDAILGPSFQLSFAAVVVLVAFYNGIGRRWFTGAADLGPGGRLSRYFLALLITSLLVTAATAPIIVFHFGRISLLGIFANLAAIPLMAFWVMPVMVLAMIAMPFGLASVPLQVMEPGLEALLYLADRVAAQSWGLWYLSRPDGVAIGAMVLTVTWLIIWQNNRMRVISMIPACIAIVLGVLHRQPDILVSGDQKGWAVWMREDQKIIVPKEISDFHHSLWQARYGIDPDHPDRATIHCDSDICRLGSGSKTILIADILTDPFYACRHADIVVNLKADMPVNACAGDRMIIDDDVLWHQGGVAIYDMATTKPWYRTVRQDAGDWPWVIIGGR
ncbi:MAG: ComEC/Rec2 family competence protein [Pseudomonadota bacterium]